MPIHPAPLGFAGQATALAAPLLSSTLSDEAAALLQEHGCRGAALRAAEHAYDAARTEAHRAYWGAICHDIEVADEVDVQKAVR